MSLTLSLAGPVCVFTPLRHKNSCQPDVNVFFFHHSCLRVSVSACFVQDVQEHSDVYWRSLLFGANIDRTSTGFRKKGSWINMLKPLPSLLLKNWMTFISWWYRSDQYGTLLQAKGQCLVLVMKNNWTVELNSIYITASHDSCFTLSPGLSCGDVFYWSWSWFRYWVGLLRKVSF